MCKVTAIYVEADSVIVTVPQTVVKFGNAHTIGAIILSYIPFFICLHIRDYCIYIQNNLNFLLSLLHFTNICRAIVLRLTESCLN